MIAFDFKVDNNFIKIVRNLGNPSKITLDQMDVFFDRVLPFIERQAVLRTPVGASRRARNSMFHDKITEGDNMIGIVANSAQHINALEDGTKPHMPPVKPLERWVRFKKLTMTESQLITALAHAIQKSMANKGKKVPLFVLIKWIQDKDIKPKNRRQFEIKSIAWAIAMKIKEDGTKGQAIFSRAFQASQSFVRSEQIKMIEGIGLGLIR